MAKMDKCVMKDNMWFIILTFISIGMLVTSLFIPPMGVIDGSVLAAVGEIFGFAALGTLLKAIESGWSAKMTKGDTVVELAPDDDEDENKKE